MKLKRYTVSIRSIDLTGVVREPLINLAGIQHRFLTRRGAAGHARRVQYLLRLSRLWRTDVVVHKVGEAPVWPSGGSNQ